MFSNAVREAATRYLTRLDADLRLERFAAVRLGTTQTGELGYPGPGPGPGPAAAFWAFDDAAQGGPGRTDGMAPAPLPGWTPGERTREGVSVAPDEARTWFRWYSDALVATVDWQVGLLRGLGFAADVHLPVAGRGVLPADLDAAVADRLGRADPEGGLGRGLDYPAQFAALARIDAADPGHLVVDVTGLDDVSAVRARALGPPQDTCRDDDGDAVAAGSGAVARWPAQRWTTANARLAGLVLVGENPGDPGLADTGGAPDSDGLAAQLRHAPRYAQECGLTEFYWAFEDALYDDRPDVGIGDLEKWARPTA